MTARACNASSSVRSAAVAASVASAVSHDPAPAPPRTPLETSPMTDPEVRSFRTPLQGMRNSAMCEGRTSFSIRSSRKLSSQWMADFVGWRDDEHHISIISLNIATRHAAFASTGAQLNNHDLASNFQGRKDRKRHEEKRSPSNPGCCSIVS